MAVRLQPQRSAEGEPLRSDRSPTEMGGRQGGSRAPADRTSARRDARRWPEWFVEIYGRVILAAAAWSLLQLILPRARPLDRINDVFALVDLPTGPSIFSGVGLLLLSGAVRRRMRAAWWLLLGFQVIALSYLFYATTAALTRTTAGRSRAAELSTIALSTAWINVALGATLVALLLTSRRIFVGALPPGERWQALATLAGGLMVSLSASITMTFLAPDTLRTTEHKLDWAIRAAFGVLPDRSDLLLAHHEHGHWWSAELAAQLSGLAVIVAVLVFVRPARPASRSLSAQDELDLRSILLAHGEHDSLGYFATRRDKAAVFTAKRDAAVTYRVVANVCLVSADPIGPPSRWRDAVETWLQQTRSNGWYPAVLAASESAAKVYVAAGLKAIAMGDEAIIDTRTFTLRGPAMAPVRRAVRRVRRMGYTITLHRHNELSSDQLALLAECAESWRLDRTERGFSMALGRLGDQLDGDSVALLAHDATGRLQGFLSLVPWGPAGLSLDLMRRDRESVNGLMEAMVAALVQQSRDELGIRQVSLNFAMFRGVFSAVERVGAGPLVRLTNRLMLLASRVWQIESLYRSNARYQPQWQTRYLCYDSPLTLARVAVAAGAAEGFLPFGARSIEPRIDDTVTFRGATMPLSEAIERQRVELRLPRLAGAQLSAQQQARVAASTMLREHGIDPYPVAVARTGSIAELRARHGQLAADTYTGHRVSVVGRVRARRDFGSLLFLVLQEEHALVQALLTRDNLDSTGYALAQRGLDIGDLVSVSGEVMASHTGELSVRVEEWQLAAKCLTPIPKLRPGAASGSVRKRHVELLTDHYATELLVLRGSLLRGLRAALTERGYLEVETPMLHTVRGGANARPFLTHMNAYDMPLYLRIAPELYLKRLAVGGLQAIFEVNRNFRNEGVDDTHNPEFTALEAYRAFADYRDMRELAWQLIGEVATAIYGEPVARRRKQDGGVITLDLSTPWPVVSVHEAISNACGTAVTPDASLSDLVELCRANAIPIGRDPSTSTLTVALYERLVEARTSEPTFYTDFPIEVSPLARTHRDDPRLAERWDLVAFGQEIGTAYSELTDPIEQRRRFVEQFCRGAGGDPEAMPMDEDFLDTLGYAMPPTGGLGIGVDRLLMLLTGVPIRPTLAFPFAGRGTAPTVVDSAVVSHEPQSRNGK